MLQYLHERQGAATHSSQVANIGGAWLCNGLLAAIRVAASLSSLQRTVFV